ncbi:protein tramtrack, beta isoform-like isoform X1 [Cloeon dipterum]|uniref:protein tramtrack, beta isoform-like isoform X1 n=1 Tax=Cloeon dipterum TaxID=197152 RepID=UPI00321FAA9D
MEFSPTKHGGVKLAFKGFEYSVHSVGATFIRWRCVRRGCVAKVCRAHLRTDIDRQRVLLEPGGAKNAHNHQPSAALCPWPPTPPKDTPGSAEASWPAVNSPQVVQRLKSGDLLNAPQSMTQREIKPILPKPSTSAAAAMSPPYQDSSQPAPQARPLQPKQTPKAAPKPKSSAAASQPRSDNDDSEPQQVCLRWNSFHSNMETMFPTLLYKEKFVDVTLACEGRLIKCHKVVLSSCSPYLERLLSDNPCKHPIVLMPKDVPYWALRAIVDFMYRGEVNVEHEQLAPLLAAAESLQIKGLAGSPGDAGSRKDGRPGVKRKRIESPAQTNQQPKPPQPTPQNNTSSQQSTSSPATATAQSSSKKEAKESPSQKHTQMAPHIAESLRGLSPGIEITPLVSFEEIKTEPIDSNDDGSLEPPDDYGIGKVSPFKGYDDGDESLPVSHVESLMEEEDMGDESDTLNDHSQIPDPNDLLSTEMEPIEEEDDSANVYSENGMDFPDCGLSEEASDLVESYAEVCMPSDPGEHHGS